MISGILGGIAAAPWARAALRCATMALTITLFLINLRRTGERAGRAAERLSMLEQNNAVQRKMLDASADRPRSRNDLLERLRNGRF